MSEQIVYNAHTPGYIWDELKARATETRIRLDVRCPACAGELKCTDTDVRCDACDAPVSFFQDRFLSCDADRRVIYLHVMGHEKKIHRLDLCCLSCEKQLDAKESCPNTCAMQTFLITKTEADQLYVKRWCVKYREDDPRSQTEIPIRQTFDHKTAEDISQEIDRMDTTPQKAILRSQHPQPTVSSAPRNPVEPETDGASSEKDVFQTPTRTNAKKDVEGQILALLPEDGTPMRAAEMLKRIHGNRKNMYGAINRLIEKEHIVNPKRGRYARRG